MRPPLTFAVGDEVVWSSVNSKTRRRLTVEKVGRTLVYVSGERHPYRLRDGSKADGYGHESIRSLAVAAWDESVGDAMKYFLAHGLRSDYSSDNNAWLVWAAGVLRAAAPLAAEGKEKAPDPCATDHDWIRRGEGSAGNRYVCLRCGGQKP